MFLFSFNFRAESSGSRPGAPPRSPKRTRADETKERSSFFVGPSVSSLLCLLIFSPDPTRQSLSHPLHRPTLSR